MLNYSLKQTCKKCFQLASLANTKNSPEHILLFQFAHWVGCLVGVLPPAQVAEHSDQGWWFHVKPTSLSPLPVRLIGTLNLYLIPKFCSWSRTCHWKQLVKIIKMQWAFIQVVTISFEEENVIVNLFKHLR